MTTISNKIAELGLQTECVDSEALNSECVRVVEQSDCYHIYYTDAHYVVATLVSE
jgi:hypothetical protein